MPSKNDVVSEQLAEIRQDLRDLWTALRTDPKVQKRKERAWALLVGALGAATTIVARQLATKLWIRLTGEPPPPSQKARDEAAEVQKEVAA